MNFQHLCDFFETINSAKGTEKSNITKTFLNKFRDESNNLQNNQDPAVNFYQILRLIVPKLDRDRQAYRIKESKIAKILIRMLDLPQGNDKTILLKSYLSTGSNFGDVVYSVIKKYITNYKSELTIDELNEQLDEIANRTTDTGLDDRLLKLFRKSSPKDTKWIIQIILKDLKLGIDGNRILNCFHEDAFNFYSTNNNLRKLCETLWNPQVKLHEIEIKIFEAFRPMLSKRCTASNFKKIFPDKTFLIENKFDGERFQIHMSQNQFKYFSRNGFDFTSSFGESFDHGLFTPQLKEVFDSTVTNVILDGEMMIWNKVNENFGSKGMKLDVKKLNYVKYQPCFCVFDMLLYNNKILTNQPLIKRLELIRKVIKTQIKGTISVSQYEEAHCRQDIVDALNLSVDKMEEGIVVKDPKSIYKCSDRNSGWFKVKMEYFDDVLHDLDLIMMGGCYGSSSRNKINSFFVGVCSNNQNYLSFGRISSGLNDEQLDYLNDMLKKHGTSQPSGNTSFGSDLPHVFIDPNNSCVLQVRASELIRSTDDRVKTPFTLRFPRVLSIRTDKPADECFSLTELLELCHENKAVIKLNKRHIDLDEIIKLSNPRKKVKVASMTKLPDDTFLGNILSGKKIYVHSGSESWAKDEIYSAIKQVGGTITFILESDVDIILSGQIDSKLETMIQENHTYDIISTNWLQRMMQGKQLVDYDPTEIISIGQKYNRNLFDSHDFYGDHFTKPATKNSLQQCLNLIRKKNYFVNHNGLVNHTGKLRDFVNYVAYFDKYDKIDDSTSEIRYNSFIDECEFKFRGGKISKEVSDDVNFIITDGGDDRKAIIERFLNSAGKSIEIKSKSFLYSDIK